MVASTSKKKGKTEVILFHRWNQIKAIKGENLIYCEFIIKRVSFYSFWRAPTNTSQQGSMCLRQGKQNPLYN